MTKIEKRGATAVAKDGTTKVQSRSSFYIALKRTMQDDEEQDLFNDFVGNEAKDEKGNRLYPKTKLQTIYKNASGANLLETYLEEVEPQRYKAFQELQKIVEDLDIEEVVEKLKEILELED
jgi:hypothetical protein